MSIVTHSGRCLLVVALALAGCGGDPLEQLIARNTEAMGGRARLERFRSLVVVHDRTVIGTLLFPDRIRVELFDTTGALRYAEGFNGTDAWEQDQTDTARRAVTGRPTAALFHASQWPTNLLPLFRMRERGHRLELLPRAIVDSVDYQRIRLTLSDGYARDYYLHPTTHRIERARDVRELHANDGKTRSIETVFTDYRQVDGVWLAHTVEEFDLDTGERLSGGTKCAMVPDFPIDPGEFERSGRSAPTRLRDILAGLQSRCPLV